MSIKCFARVLALRRVLSSISDLHVKQIAPTLSRQITLSTVHRQEEDEGDMKAKKEWKYTGIEGAKGFRVNVVDYTESMMYLESDAYRSTYGNDPVWKPYRRNVPGHYAPPTRWQCVRAGHIATGSACPVCRDDYLVLDYRNLKLLKQFIYNNTNDPLPTSKTGICQQQQKRLVIELAKAKDCGLLEMYVPHRDYNYDDYREPTPKTKCGKRKSSSQKAS